MKGHRTEQSDSSHSVLISASQLIYWAINIGVIIMFYSKGGVRLTLC